MKKYLFAATAAALALVSCQKEEPVASKSAPVNEVALKGVSNLTKSAINGTTFPDGYDILVSAYRNLDATHKGTDAADNYFEGIQFSKNGTVWKGKNPKYWPLTGKLDFLCIASAGLKTAANGITPTCVWKASNVASEVDVTVPANSGKFDDIMYGATNGESYLSAGNAVSFKHAQAAVVFTAKSNIAYDEEKNIGITIDKITVDGAKYGGILKVSNPASGGQTGALSANWTSLQSVVEHQQARVWSSTGLGVKADEPSLSDLNLTTSSALLTAKPFGEAYVLLPQQAQVPFTVTYTIHNGFKADGETPLDNQIQYQWTGNAGNWEMGKKYVYDINITLNEITIAPSVTNWDSQTAVDVPIHQ